MFRIKNVRNPTVAKQSNISPAIPRNQVAIPVNRLGIKAMNTKLGQPKEKNRITVTKKLTGNNVKLNGNLNRALNKIDPHAVNINLDLCKKVQIPNKSHLRGNEMKKQPLKVQHPTQIKENIVNLQSKGNLENIKVEPYYQKPAIEELACLDKEITNAQKRQLQEFIKKEDQARKREQDLQYQRQLEQAQKKKRQQRQKRRIQRQIQEQKDKQRELQLQKTMQKVQARRKARQEQNLRRKLKQQQDKKRQAQIQSIGGMVTLSDQLAHVHMTEAIMDRQINKLLSMKFANFPNKQAIQHQVEELERINTSYLLVRQDPNNPLIRGLSNFRIQLFNRVGELIMQGQNMLGPQASGLQIIQADSHQNHPNLGEGVKITRGLQNETMNVLKTRRLQHQQECSICLNTVSTQQEVYNVKCGHIFHKNCLEDWLVNTANCPACRYNIKYDHY